MWRSLCRRHPATGRSGRRGEERLKWRQGEGIKGLEGEIILILPDKTTKINENHHDEIQDEIAELRRDPQAKI